MDGGIPGLGLSAPRPCPRLRAPAAARFPPAQGWRGRWKGRMLRGGWVPKLGRSRWIGGSQGLGLQSAHHCPVDVCPGRRTRDRDSRIPPTGFFLLESWQPTAGRGTTASAEAQAA